jgi:hypothetical protein
VRAVARGRGGFPGGVRQCSGKRYDRSIRPFLGARKGRRAACALDLEGVVGKWANGTCQTDGRCTSWVKFKNPEYSQMEARHELSRLRAASANRDRRGCNCDLPK